MFDSTEIEKANQLTIDQADMVEVYKLSNNIENATSAIASLEKIASFIQTERSRKSEKNQGHKKFIDDESILSGVTSAIGIAAETIKANHWALRQYLGNRLSPTTDTQESHS